MFVLSMLFAIAFTAVAWVLAPAVAAFFHAPRLTLVARVLSLSFILNALGEAHESQLKKRMQFGRWLVPGGHLQRRPRRRLRRPRPRGRRLLEPRLGPARRRRGAHADVLDALPLAPAPAAPARDGRDAPALRAARGAARADRARRHQRGRGRSSAAGSEGRARHLLARVRAPADPHDQPLERRLRRGVPGVRDRAGRPRGVARRLPRRAALDVARARARRRRAVRHRARRSSTRSTRGRGGR